MGYQGWVLDCEDGKEWNLSYVLPSSAGADPIFVNPTSLQMGWISSPPYFCAASKTGQDVAAQDAELPVRLLTPHPFLSYTHGDTSLTQLPQKSDITTFQYMVEVYVDDFVGLAIPTSRNNWIMLRAR